jgi:hypothetical protein
VVFAVSLPIAVVAAWVRGTVLSTSGYVAAVTPTAQNPAVRTAVQAAVTEEVQPVLASAATSALPPAEGLLAGLFSGGLADLAGQSVNAVMASPAFQGLWADLNRSAHSQLIDALNGNDDALATTNGEVALNVAPFINIALKSAAARLSTLTGETVTAPVISAVPADACRQVAHLTRTQLPVNCGLVPLFPAAALARARFAFRVTSTATLGLLILVPLTAAAALLAAPRRRRTLLQLAAGGTLTVLIVIVTLARFQSSLIGRQPSRWQPAVNAIVHALTGGFFTLAAWCVAGGVVLAAAVLLLRPGPWHAAATLVRARRR